jgi:hypothetical protein
MRARRRACLGSPGRDQGNPRKTPHHARSVTVGEAARNAKARVIASYVRGFSALRARPHAGRVMALGCASCATVQVSV